MQFHAITILTVRHKGRVSTGGDGQVTLDNIIVKACLARPPNLPRNGEPIARCGDSSSDPTAAPVVSAIQLTPSEIVAELAKYIVGQHEAERAVAIAIRNRWRRQQLALELAAEISPKNILMIGLTGVG